MSKVKSLSVPCIGYEIAVDWYEGENGVPFIPLFYRFDQAVKSGEGLLPDGLHPNDKGHQLMYEIIKPELERIMHDSN